MKQKYFYHEHLADYAELKIVIFDLFETLVSEFNAGRPSNTEVAQTLGLPVADFQRIL